MSQLRRMPESSTHTNNHGGIGAHADATNDRKWELWKCRVEFDERAVYFTMARVLKGSYDDNRVMEFVLMKLAFPPEVPERTSPFSSPSSNPSILTDTSHSSQPKSPVMSPPSSVASSPNNSKCLTVMTMSSSASNSPCSSPMSSSTALPVDLGSVDCEEQLLVSHSNQASADASSRSLSQDGTRMASATCVSEPLTGPKESTGETAIAKPTFLPLTSFYTTGVVMNVFLLDPPRRLLSAFVWLASSNTIGLYVLLDWDEDEYIYVDTGVGCLISSNWSCILHNDQIVIHSEEADAAYQHFYPLNALRGYSRTRNGALKLSSQLSSGTANGIVGHNDGSAGEETQSRAQKQDYVFIRRHHLPSVSARLPPIKSVSKKFVFPRASVASGAGRDVPSSTPTTLEAFSLLDVQPVAGPSSSAGSPIDDGSVGDLVDDDAGMGITEPPRESRIKGKGKERVVEGDAVADGSPSQPFSELPRSKGKGKMREIIDRNAKEHDDVHHEEIERQNGLSASNSSSEFSLAIPHQAAAVAQQSTSLDPTVQSPEPAPNPYPFPPWYPESAHFVRQWWPTLPGVPRLSCTVVLLAAHDPETHRTRFVLAQHYFKVPITRPTDVDKHNSGSSADEDDRDEDDEMLHLWYVSTPFEVVCVLDSPADNGEDEDTGDRPRPLVAVDFGHAVWVEYAAEPGGVYGVDASRLVGDAAQFTDSEEEDGVEGSGEEGSSDLFEGMGAAPVSQGVQTTTDLHTGAGTIFDTRRHRVPKCLRFVTFPPVHMANERRHGKGRAYNGGGRTREEAIVRTLEIPEELDLDGVETINIDQSQGAVILSVKEGKIFILRYE